MIVTVFDSQAPEAYPDSMMMVTSLPGVCYELLSNLLIPPLSDNCEIDTAFYIGMAQLSVGTHTVSLSVADVHGNNSTYEQFVTVIDNELPTLTGLDSVMHSSDPGKCEADVYVPLPIAFDNCGVAEIINNYNGASDVTGTYPVGTTIIVWEITDLNGNSNSYAQKIVVTDNEAPIITCASDTVLVNDLGICEAFIEVSRPIISDNCEIDFLINDYTGDSVATANYPVGEKLLEWTVYDVHGNISTCIQSIIVEDKEQPVFMADSVITVSLDTGKCYKLASNLEIPFAGDNCGVAELKYIGPDTLYKGLIVISWEAIDIHGNSTILNQEVTVIDTEAPIVVLPEDYIQLNDSGTCVAAIVLEEPMATDNCLIQLIINDAPAIFEKGLTIVTWTITDDSDNSTQVSQNVTVVNPLPLPNSFITTYDPIHIDSMVTISTSSDDDNLVYAYWEWGDGNSSTTDIGNISESHQYSEPGVYSPAIVLIDVCGDSTVTYVSDSIVIEDPNLKSASLATEEADNTIKRYIVIYDPEGGFVTGGGLIYSPAGASNWYPEATGVASFGFVSKYVKNKVNPDGNTAFKFQAGDLDFKSTEYEWLVVAGSKAKFKGWGKINGEGEYGFIISAIDGDVKEKGDPDLFRIKIWDRYTEEVAYDNEIGNEIDADPSTTLLHGSIVVHSLFEKSAHLFAETEIKEEGFNIFNVYPNPTSGILNITGFIPSENYILKLFDMSGREILIKNVNSDDAEIDITHLHSGVYNILIQDDSMATYKCQIIKR